MNCLKNEKGVALITSLLLTLITLAICMALLYFITMGTKMSASQKRFSTALSATYGGTELAKDIIPRLMAYSSVSMSVSSMTGFSNIGLTFPTSGSSDQKCLGQKLRLDSSQWTQCTSDNKTVNAKLKPDFTFKLQGLTPGSGYTVYTKIISTIPGNSDTSGIDYLDMGLSVSQGGSAVIAPQHFPGLYTLEVQGERETNAKERAMLSALYAF